MPTSQPPLPPPTLELQRITTQYDAPQDRICLLAQANDNGLSYTLWFTQRLMRLLLPTLWQWLEQHDTPAATHPATTAHSGHTEAWNEMAQQAACAQRTEDTPSVRPHTFSQQWLVCSIQLQASTQAVQLHLSSTQGSDATPTLGDASAQLTLSALLLRQWLAILLSLHQQAEWPTDHWPQWLTHASGTPAAPKQALLH